MSDDLLSGLLDDYLRAGAFPASRTALANRVRAYYGELADVAERARQREDSDFIALLSAAAAFYLGLQDVARKSSDPRVAAVSAALANGMVRSGGALPPPRPAPRRPEGPVVRGRRGFKS